MGERIKELRKVLGLTQKEFGERIGVKPNTIGTYEIGRNEPIDAVVALICREFNVNEEWLRTGHGEMFQSMEDNDVISGFMADVFNDDTDFRRRFLSILAKLSPAEWALIESMARKLAESEKKASPEGLAPEDITDQ